MDERSYFKVQIFVSGVVASAITLSICLLVEWLKEKAGFSNAVHLLLTIILSLGLCFLLFHVSDASAEAAPLPSCTCQSCGATVDTPYCEQCRAAVNVTTTPICPECGTECDTPFCGDCGTPMNLEG